MPINNFQNKNIYTHYAVQWLGPICGGKTIFIVLIFFLADFTQFKLLLSRAKYTNRIHNSEFRRHLWTLNSIKTCISQLDRSSSFEKSIPYEDVS